MRRTTLALILALSFVRGTALAESYSDAMAAAGYCRSETSWAQNNGNGDWTATCGDSLGHVTHSCWHETDIDGAKRVYCGSDEQNTCGLYAAWAYWACEHGYPTADPELGCLAAADDALETCGEW